VIFKKTVILTQTIYTYAEETDKSIPSVFEFFESKYMKSYGHFSVKSFLVKF